MRSYNRDNDQLRPVEIIPNYTEMAAGSAMISCGKTKVLCTASFQPGVPGFLKGKNQGWITAEYAMLPGATPVRKARDGVKKDGRGVEISRLIGRSLRACCDLTRLGENTITLDCDVLQADGGTRTASITGAFVALCLAVNKLLANGTIKDSPVISQLAAVSVGIPNNTPVLDLDYSEDSGASVDMNLVMTGAPVFLSDTESSEENASVSPSDRELSLVEVQGTGEGRAFSRKEMNILMDLAENGIHKLMEAQLDALGDASMVIGKKPLLIVASNNFGKLHELRVLLSKHFDVISMKQIGIDMDIEETGETFEENALIKANALLQQTGCACIADDSGLEVDALGGRPGVYSARYAGIHGDDEANNQKLLQELEQHEDRTARYVCCMALVRPGHLPLISRGTCEGRILREYRGTGGFGYDPLFYSEDLHETFAEADLEAKNTVSHRARAIRLLLQILNEESNI